MAPPQLVLALLLVAISATPTTCFYRMVDTDSLVANQREGVVYLFQLPRTSHSPSSPLYFSALCMKTETWLHWSGIKFHRVDNLSALGAHTREGVLPFAYYNGKYYDGSDAIIAQIGKQLGKYTGEEDVEEQMYRRLIDDKIYKLLIVDRTTRDEKGAGGLDWFLEDQAIIENVVPLFMRGVVDLTFWKGYFEAREKPVFLGQTLASSAPDRKFTSAQLRSLDEALRKQIRMVLTNTFVRVLDTTKTDDSSEALLRDMLALHNPFSGGAQTFLELQQQQNGSAVLRVLKNYLKPILAKLRLREQQNSGFFPSIGMKQTNNSNNKFLFGTKPTPADASLFAVLVQFFETPLNVKQLREFFQPGDGKLSADAQLLKSFVDRVKQSLGLGGGAWDRLAERPWPLNYEPVDLEPENVLAKYNGPFAIQNTDSMENLLNEDGTAANGELAKEIQLSVQAILAYVGRQAHNVQIPLKRFTLSIVSAYLCNFGLPKRQQEECARKHMDSIVHFKYVLPKFGEKQQSVVFEAHHMFSTIGDHKQIAETIKTARQIAYQTIVAFNDDVNKLSVMKAMGKAVAVGAVGNWVTLGEMEF